jgi:hypothetical protein
VESDESPWHHAVEHGGQAMGNEAGEILLIDAVGGRVTDSPMDVALRDGTVVHLAFGLNRRSEDRFHLALRVDGAATHDRRAPRWEPERQVAWVAESPAHAWTHRVPTIADRYRRVLTHDAELIARGAPFERFHAGFSWVRPSSAAKTRLVSMIASTLGKFPGHRFRLQAMERARGAGVDCFGRGHREIATKNEGLDAYRFSVAMENARRDEYFTEKLVDCFLTETVPVYWGFPSLATVFDARGVLSFATLAELDDALASLSPSLYDRMQPHVLENRRRVEALGLDSVGRWCRLAEVLRREARGLCPAPRPRSLVCALARRLRLGQPPRPTGTYVIEQRA